VIAFSLSVLVTILAVPVLVWLAKRRPPGTPLSWGESLAAATGVFFLFWWSYGMVPHLWMVWADNELGWRADAIVLGPGGILTPQEQGGWLPVTISYQAVRDIIAVAIYGVYLAAPVAAWAYWQNRGERAETPEIETTTYGRPLVKKGAS
jgi:hypothetical protein